MNNKILVNVFSPEFSEVYEIFIPVNEYVSVVVNLISNVIANMNGIDGLTGKKYILMNKKTLQIYSNKSIVRDTDIENSVDLVLL
jgi:hypothetical protein